MPRVVLGAPVSPAEYTRVHGEAKLNSESTRADGRFLIVMSLSFVLGMAVALAIFLYWRVHGGQIPDFFSVLALLLCPPFVLASVTGPTPDSDFALVLISGTIVFANAVLYAGFAAGIYFVATVVAKRRRRVL